MPNFAVQLSVYVLHKRLSLNLIFCTSIFCSSVELVHGYPGGQWNLTMTIGFQKTDCWI
jgi:hypothetical protein